MFSQVIWACFYRPWQSVRYHKIAVDQQTPCNHACFRCTSLGLLEGHKVQGLNGPLHRPGLHFVPLLA